MRPAHRFFPLAAGALLLLGLLVGCKFELRLPAPDPCEDLTLASPARTAQGPPMATVGQPVVLTVLARLEMRQVRVEIRPPQGASVTVPLTYDAGQSTADTWAYYGTWTPTAPGTYTLVAYGMGRGCEAEASSATRTLQVAQPAPLQSGQASPAPPLTLVPPTPVAWASPTLSPVSTSTATASAPLVVDFRAQPASVLYGQCSTLLWQTQHARQVLFEGQPVAAEGQRQVCPKQTTTYHLRVQDGGGQWHDYSAMVQVAPLPPSPTVTASPTPDQRAPVAPEPLSPGSPNAAQPARLTPADCPLTLRWRPVSDPSGVHYEVRVNRQIAPNAWAATESFQTDQPQFTLSSASFCEPTDYNWFVRAIDGAGNASGFSQALYYTLDNQPPNTPVTLGPGTTDPNHPEIISESTCPPTLRWTPVSDPNGVSYEVTLARRILGSGQWDSIIVSTMEQTSYTPPQDWCGYTLYRWAVRARDLRDNISAWSPWRYYEIPVP